MFLLLIGVAIGFALAFLVVVMSTTSGDDVEVAKARSDGAKAVRSRNVDATPHQASEDDELARVARLESAARAGTRPPPLPTSAKASDHADDEDIVRLAMQGKKLDAIRRYRERHFVGLAEAKAAVEALEHGGPIPDPPASPPDAVAVGELREGELRKRRKINAIKIYREEHGVGLREAKDAVDAIEAAERKKGN